MKYLVLMLLALVSYPNHAATDCGKLSIQEFYIEAERATDPKYSNMLLIRLSDENGLAFTCANKAYAYIENAAPSYDSIYSFFLLTYTQRGTYGLVVDENTTVGEAVRIEYIFPR